jgi:hypothetical protein
MIKSNKIYVAVVDDPTKITIVDATTGIRLNSVRVQHPILNGPVIVGDKMTLVLQRNNGSRQGVIYNLPSGILSKQFSI